MCTASFFQNNPLRITRGVTITVMWHDGDIKSGVERANLHFEQFPGDADAAGLDTTLRDPLS